MNSPPPVSSWIFPPNSVPDEPIPSSWSQGLTSRPQRSYDFFSSFPFHRTTSHAKGCGDRMSGSCVHIPSCAHRTAQVYKRTARSRESRVLGCEVDCQRASQSLLARVCSGALLAMVPDPVTCFEDASFRQVGGHVRKLDGNEWIAPLSSGAARKVCSHAAEGHPGRRSTRFLLDMPRRFTGCTACRFVPEEFIMEGLHEDLTITLPPLPSRPKLLLSSHRVNLVFEKNAIPAQTPTLGSTRPRILLAITSYDTIDVQADPIDNLYSFLFCNI